MGPIDSFGVMYLVKALDQHWLRLTLDFFPSYNPKGIGKQVNIGNIRSMEIGLIHFLHHH